MCIADGVSWQECATALAELATSVTAVACEAQCVRGIVTLSKDRVWAVRVAAAAAIPAIAAGQCTPGNPGPSLCLSCYSSHDRLACIQQVQSLRLGLGPCGNGWRRWCRTCPSGCARWRGIPWDPSWPPCNLSISLTVRLQTLLRLQAMLLHLFGL